MEERVWNTVSCSTSAGFGAFHFEIASLCVVNRIGGGRERRIRRSMEYLEVVSSSKSPNK